MFYLEEVRMGGSGLQVTFTNPYDAYHLLGKAFGAAMSSSASPSATSIPSGTASPRPPTTCTASHTSSPTRTSSEGDLQLEPKMCCLLMLDLEELEE
jgi:hypothetical protein